MWRSHLRGGGPVRGREQVGAGLRVRGLRRGLTLGTSSRALRRAALIALSAVALVACGDDDDRDDFSPAVTEPLSKVEFLREADRICHSTEARIEAAADDLVTAPGDPDPAEVERIAIDLVVPALETEVRAIRALGAPPGDEPEVDAILTETERGIAAIEADPRALLDGIPAPLRRAQRLAERYGSQQCGLRPY